MPLTIPPDATAAALAHPHIGEFRQGPFAACWTDDALARDPPIVLECEHGCIIDSLTQALHYLHRHRTRFGPARRVRALQPTDPLHPARLVSVLYDSSPSRQRFLARQRQRLPEPDQPSLPLDAASDPHLHNE